MNPLFHELQHRPWAAPKRTWVMAQRWHDLLFAHWPVTPNLLRAHIPGGLEIDTHQGRAWIAVVPFRMEAVRLRFAPEVPGISRFPELNVRTYVKRGGKPGVWFFSLDAANALAVTVARAWFHLPYFRAEMRCEDLAGWIEYQSQRRHRGAAPAILNARYRGIGEKCRAKPGSLEHFLIERYCLYAAAANGGLLRGEIHHAPWELQIAEAEFSDNSMADSIGVPLDGPPLLHFSRRQDVVVWPPVPA